MNKLCNTCKVEYPEESFAWNRSGLTRMAKCPNCVAENARLRMARSRAKSRGEDWQPKVHKQEPCSVQGHVCKDCGTAKPCDAYFASNTFKLGHESTCKECKNQRRRERVAKAQDALTLDNRFRNDQLATLKRRYNISGDQYLYLLEIQNNLCFLCEQDETRVSHHSGKVMSLAVDHDRKCCPGTKSCGKCIRGLLCTDCNTALGKLECKPKLIEKLNLGQYIHRRPLENYVP